MSKRKAASASTDINFAVIETIQGDTDVLLEFLPNIWLKQVNQKRAIKARESAKYYYPRQLANQSKVQYLKFLKHAKFECMEPKDDWDLLDCKVLKLGIGN